MIVNNQAQIQKQDTWIDDIKIYNGTATTTGNAWKERNTA